MTTALRHSLAVAFLVSLAGCATPQAMPTGMTTTLNPGQRLMIAAHDGNPVVHLTCGGPGNVTFLRESNPPSEVLMGPRGDAQLSAANGGFFFVINDSTQAASIDVRVTGSSYVRIEGPVVTSPDK